MKKVAACTAVMLIGCTASAPSDRVAPTVETAAAVDEQPAKDDDEEQRSVWLEGIRLTCGFDDMTGTSMKVRIATPRGFERADLTVDLTLTYRTGKHDDGRLRASVTGPNDLYEKLEPHPVALSSPTKTTTTVRWVGELPGDGRRYEVGVSLDTAPYSCSDGGLFRVSNLILQARATGVGP